MITLAIPPKEQISRVNKMLTDEFGTASRIKSHENKLSVLSAITSTQQRLKQYKQVPTNGLVIFCGMVVGEDGKGKKMNVDIEPLKPIKHSVYLCDKRFHTDCLSEQLEDSDKFGFIIMDGNGCLYGTLQGSNRQVLHKFSVDLPKKHGRGGQSALRFARLRLEKRHNYVRKVAELAVSLFIYENMPNVKGLVLGGSAEFKNQLVGSDLFDSRLKQCVLKTVDVAYGGELGFNQAIELSGPTLGSVKLIHEKYLLQKWFEAISMDTGKYCFMLKDTLEALEAGAVETLMIWEQLDIDRLVLRNNSTNEEKVVFLTKLQQQETGHFKEDMENGTRVELETISIENITDYFAENYKKWGCKLEFITNRSQEGSQFCRGFGGIGGMLRWKVDFLEVGEVGESKITGGGAEDAKTSEQLQLEEDDEWYLM